MKNFALIGVSGFVAPRHLKAIHATGNRLIAAVDPHDSVGILDTFFRETRFFTEIERFDRYLEKLRRQSDEDRAHYISICSPNYLHDAHVRLALRLRAHAICEKPLVINPWNLDALQDLEAEYGSRIYTVLQLRHHPSLIALKETLGTAVHSGHAEVCLTYITRRGPWYQTSWKGSLEKSGGVAMNIGIHLFDLLNWLFGPVERCSVHLSTQQKMAGVLELAGARVRWFLSVDAADLPVGYTESGRSAFRSITVNGEEVEFSEGFGDLHTRVYEEVLAGRGYGIEDAKPSIDLVHSVRNSPIVIPKDDAHPMLV